MNLCKRFKHYVELKLWDSEAIEKKWKASCNCMWAVGWTTDKALRDAAADQHLLDTGGELW